MAQWNTSVWGPDRAPYLYSIFLSRTLYLLCSSLAFCDTHGKHYTVLRCTEFCLFVSLCFLPHPTDVSQGLSSISMSTTGPFAAPFLMWFSAEVFLSWSLKPKVWYLTYSEIFRKNSEGKKKRFFSADIRIQVSTEFLKAVLNIVSFCSANSHPLYLWWAGRSFFKQWRVAQIWEWIEFS